MTKDIIAITGMRMFAAFSEYEEWIIPEMKTFDKYVIFYQLMWSYDGSVKHVNNTERI